MEPNGPHAEEADPFGIYRAEWLSGALFKLFSRPAYYPELETPRPCVLVGGRGTGKTTVLRCLSYDGRFVLEGENPEHIPSWRYYGLYYRVNTNRVTAFRGSELSNDQWTRAFAHYINLLLCGQVLVFLNWYTSQTNGTDVLDAGICVDIADSLFVDRTNNQVDLLKAIERGQKKFERFLNNIDPQRLPPLSLQAAPIDELCGALLKLPQFIGKSIFFIIDEYESLLDYQQEVMNTLIKHCGQSYTFKIGVRELGWRKRATLNPNEQLISPADYERIDISQRLEGENFSRFAAEVCNLRAKSSSLVPDHVDVTNLFPKLSIDAEANLLGVEAQKRKILKQISHDEKWRVVADSMPPLELYFADYWARAKNKTVSEVLEERSRFPSAWSERYGNYKVAILFTLKSGKVGIRKYYAGWRTYVMLADGNIRYLLELVGQARLLQRQDGKDPNQPIMPEIQSRAAQAVGRKNLAELEGLSVHGAQLTKLLLSLGRVFEILAEEPEGHTPEVTQFSLPEDSPLGAAESLLTSAVMHLALVRTVSSKRMDLELKAYDYAVHPIYSAFFTFSHRKKRKIKLTPSQLMAFVEEPRAAIRQVLKQHNREGEYPLPEQLQLFGGFYGASA